MTDEQNWEEPDVTEAQEDLANSYSGFAESYKPQQGENRLRVCPARRGAKWFLQVNQHYEIGPKNRTYPCPRSLDESAPCVLCDIAEELKVSEDPAQQAEYKRIRAGKRYLISLVDLAALDKGIQVWKCPTTVWREILRAIQDPDFRSTPTEAAPDGHSILHPLDGRNIKVTMTGSKMSTEYTLQVMPQQTKFPLELSVLDELPDLEATINFADDTEMESTYYDEGTGDGSEDDGYEPPREDDVREPEDLPQGEEYEPEAGDAAAEAEAEAEADPEVPARRRPLAPTRRPAAPAAPVRRAPAQPAAQPAKAERAPVGRPGRPQTATRPSAATGPAAQRTEVRQKAATARRR